MKVFSDCSGYPVSFDHMCHLCKERCATEEEGIECNECHRIVSGHREGLSIFNTDMCEVCAAEAKKIIV